MQQLNPKNLNFKISDTFSEHINLSEGERVIFFFLHSCPEKSRTNCMVQLGIYKPKELSNTTVFPCMDQKTKENEHTKKEHGDIFFQNIFFCVLHRLIMQVWNDINDDRMLIFGCTITLCVKSPECYTKYASNCSAAASLLTHLSDC